MATEQESRETIDGLLKAAGWSVTDAAQANITAHRGVAIRGQSAGMLIGTRAAPP